MKKTLSRFTPYCPDQILLLPPDMKEWLPEDDLAYVMMEVVAALDLAAVYDHYSRSGSGQPPYSPRMMTSLILYACCVGLPGSRKIEAATYTRIPFRVITADQHPDHDTIADFRKTHLQALAALFVNVLQLCQKAGLVKLGRITLDGTKVKANASKHKAMSYDRMDKTLEQLEAEVAQLLEEAQAAAKREAMAQQEEALKQEGKMRKVKPSKGPSDTPDPKAQRNFTDPESCIMKDGASKSFE